MRSRWTAALAALWFGAIVPWQGAEAQRRRPEPPKPPALTLGQNVPNPFDADTRIPFTVGDTATCRDSARTHRVSLGIYNLLSQVVAIPVLISGPSGPVGNLPLDGLPLSCGAYVAWWDGRYLSTRAPAAPGIYLFRLESEGASKVGKMVRTR